MSAWKPEEFAELGLKVRGLDGWRKLKPKANHFDKLLVGLTQKIVFRLPKQAVNLFVSRQNSTANTS